MLAVHVNRNRPDLNEALPQAFQDVTRKTKTDDSSIEDYSSHIKRMRPSSLNPVN